MKNETNKAKTRDLTPVEVAHELGEIFERVGIQFDECLVTTVEDFAANHGDITAARMVTYARNVEKDGRSFDYFLNTLRSSKRAEVHVVRCFIPAKKEVSHG